VSTKSIIAKALEHGKGILRLAPNWVPRLLFIPGRRIKLHPDDYYALGADRGGTDERWLGSTTPADNGPLTCPNEGLSFVLFEDNGKIERVLLRDAIDELKDEILGKRMWEQHQCWATFSKFFDNMGVLPHHIHQRDKHAALTGQKRYGKRQCRLRYDYDARLRKHGGLECRDAGNDALRPINLRRVFCYRRCG